MSAPLILHEDRLFPAEPSARGITAYRPDPVADAEDERFGPGRGTVRRAGTRAYNLPKRAYKL